MDANIQKTLYLQQKSYYSMKTVLVTGGIGSGKSVVCDFLRSRGVPVYDSDSMTKSLYDRDPELVRLLEKTFRRKLMEKDGTLDRARLSKVIFSSKKALAKLEAIIHPFVLEDFLSWKEAAQLPSLWPFGDEPFVCMESAIALSKPIFRGAFDKVVIVDAPEEVRIDRVLSRNPSLSREDILKRISSQEAIDHSLADSIIVNDSDLEQLLRRAEAAFSTLF